MKIAMYLTAGIAAALVLSAPATAQEKASKKSGSGSAQFVVVAPCYGIEALAAPLPRSIKTPIGIFIDDKQVGGVVTCSMSRVSVPAGEHSVRIGESALAFLGVSGPKRQQSFSAGHTIYYDIMVHQYGRVSFEPISAAKAQAMIAALPKNY